jgi:hypothetical protein
MSAFRLHDIEATAAKGINVVIDTPKGSRNKYKYDEALGLRVACSRSSCLASFAPGRRKRARPCATTD